MAVLLFTLSACSLNPILRAAVSVEPIGRVAIERYVGATPAITWVSSDEGIQVQQAFWRFLCKSAAEDKTSVLALPALTAQQLNKLVELSRPETGGTGQIFVEVEPMPEAAPVPGLRALPKPATGASASPRVPLDVMTTTRRSQAWVSRTLTPEGLGFCPYTASATLSGARLQSDGVDPAPISYVCSSATGLPELLTDFWDACADMLASGEAATSSIILSAPHYDTRWDEWCRVVFPVLEASVLASGLGRDLGIVCFHPAYDTPSEEWLARHRFGHMHSTRRLRGYVEMHDPELGSSTDDGSISWAGAYQRRSPHAMINVLWSRHLEVAEKRRKSSALYTRNIAKALGAGREALDRAAADERAVGWPK